MLQTEYKLNQQSMTSIDLTETNGHNVVIQAHANTNIHGPRRFLTLTKLQQLKHAIIYILLLQLCCISDVNVMKLLLGVWRKYHRINHI